MANVEIPRLYIPEKELGYRNEIEKLDLIATSLQAIDLNPFELVYCGIEGRPLVSGKKLPVRDETFGFSYADYKELAEKADKYGSAGELNPLGYALDVDDIPAMLVYDQALIEERSTLYLWRAKPGVLLGDASRAVLFFAEAQ